MDGMQANEAGSSLVSITVLSVTPMRAGRLFALASVEIDIDGVRIEVPLSARCASPLARPGWNSRRSAMPQANRARRFVLPEEVHGPVGDAVIEALIERGLAKRRFSVPIPD
jgi:hypothetical protein